MPRSHAAISPARKSCSIRFSLSASRIPARSSLIRTSQHTSRAWVKRKRSEVAGLRSKSAGVPRGMAPSQRHLKDFDLIVLIPLAPLGNQGGKRRVSLSRSEAGSEASVGRGKAKLSPSKKPMREPSGLTNHIPRAYLLDKQGFCSYLIKCVATTTKVFNRGPGKGNTAK